MTRNDFYKLAIDIPAQQRDELSQKLTSSLVTKLEGDSSAQDQQRVFLLDLLAAELKRQNRLLG